MTKPTEEAAKLAEKIATDIIWDYLDLGDDPDYRADQFRLHILEEIAKHLAAKDAEIERLQHAHDRFKVRWEQWVKLRDNEVTRIDLKCGVSFFLQENGKWASNDRHMERTGYDSLNEAMGWYFSRGQEPTNEQ